MCIQRIPVVYPQKLQLHHESIESGRGTDNSQFACAAQGAAWFHRRTAASDTLSVLNVQVFFCPPSGQNAFEGADTPPSTGRSDGLPRAATAPSSGWLQCVFNGCRHTSQDGQLHGPPRRPDRSMSHSAARHTQTGHPVQLAPSVVVCPQPQANTTSFTLLHLRSCFFFFLTRSSLELRRSQFKMCWYGRIKRGRSRKKQWFWCVGEI